jgi:hypothetical protein
MLELAEIYVLYPNRTEKENEKTKRKKKNVVVSHNL